MDGQCPQCGARIEAPWPGTYQCQRCGAQAELRLPGDPAAEPAAPGPATAAGIAAAGSTWPGSPGVATAPPLQAPCAVHPSNPAAGVCDRCGDFMCRLCTTAVEGHAYCPRCFDLLYTRGSLQFAQQQFNQPGVTLALGISALLFSWCLVLNLPLAIGGFAVGARALKQHREQPELPNRGLTITGLVLSGLSLAAALGLIALFVLVARM